MPARKPKFPAGKAAMCTDPDCEYVRYRDSEGVRVFWCSLTDEVITDLGNCPLDRWRRRKLDRHHRP